MLPSILIVDIGQNYAAEYNIAAPSGCVDVDIETDVDCSGITVEVTADFSIASNDSVEITTTVVPLGGGDPLVIGPDGADASSTGSWYYYETISAIPDGDYDVTVRATGVNADTAESFDQSLGPVRLTRVNCFDVTVECAGANPGITVTPLVEFFAVDNVEVSVHHRQTFFYETAQLTNTDVFIPFADTLAAPGSFSWSVGQVDASSFASGSVFCIEFNPGLSCRSKLVPSTTTLPMHSKT